MNFWSIAAHRPVYESVVPRTRRYLIAPLVFPLSSRAFDEWYESLEAPPDFIYEFSLIGHERNGVFFAQG